MVRHERLQLGYKLRLVQPVEREPRECFGVLARTLSPYSTILQSKTTGGDARVVGSKVRIEGVCGEYKRG